jgi:hypothetical protein
MSWQKDILGKGCCNCETVYTVWAKVTCHSSSWHVFQVHSCACIVFSWAFGKRMHLGHLCLYVLTLTPIRSVKISSLPN